MANDDSEIFGFNRSDADAILANLQQLGGVDVTGTRRPLVAPLLAQTKTGGLGANSSGNVFYMEPTTTGWQVTTTEYLAFNPTSTAIAASKLCLLFPVNGRWLAVEMCP